MFIHFFLGLKLFSLPYLNSCIILKVVCLLPPLTARVVSSLQLYEQILAENEKLKAQLRDTDLELADLKLQLEKATQVLGALAASADRC